MRHLSLYVALSLASTTGNRHFADAFSHATPHHWPPSSPTLKHSDRTTWNEYEHEFVDPLTSTSGSAGGSIVECSPEEDDDCYWVASSFEATSAAKRNVADAYWLQKYKDDQDKLHHMTDHTADNISIQNTGGIGTKDTWDHYEHEYIDHLEQPHFEAGLKRVQKNPMTEEKRKMADEYWAAKNKEDKEKMSNMSGMDLLP